jgi:ribonuclease BN (tRNA processing enzyme)
VKLALLGVRGSTPAPGAQFVRYGGHTSCVAVLSAGQQSPSLVLDAGTGLRELPRLMAGRPFRGALVLSHLHWDHLQGLPFCPSVDHPEARVDLFLPTGPTGAERPRELLARGMSPPHFPIGPDGLLGGWRFRPARPGLLPVPAAVVSVAAVPHKGGPTIGIRVELDGASVAYLPDHLPDGQPDAALRALIGGADLLLHDGQFLDRERDRARDYGHATIGEALRLADQCGVRRLVLTHHAPHRTDDALDALAAAVTSTPEGRPVRFARQGEVLDVPAGTVPPGTAASSGSTSRVRIDR